MQKQQPPPRPPEAEYLRGLKASGGATTSASRDGTEINENLGDLRDYWRELNVFIGLCVLRPSPYTLGASAAAISHSLFVQFGRSPRMPRPTIQNWHPPHLPRARYKPTVSTPGLINYHRLLVDNDRSEQWHAPWRQAEALESAHVLGTIRGRISLHADKRESGIRANKDTKLRAWKERNGANGCFCSSLTHGRPSISPSSVLQHTPSEFINKQSMGTPKAHDMHHHVRE